MGDYNIIYFIDAECQNLYYVGLTKTKLLPKRGICLDIVPEKLPTFHNCLVATG